MIGVECVEEAGGGHLAFISCGYRLRAAGDKLGGE